MAQTVTLVTNAKHTGLSAPPLVFDGHFIAAGSATTLTVNDNRAIVKLDTATGSDVILPAATGSGMTFRFVVSVLATTTDSHTISAAGTNTLQGVLLHMDNVSNNVNAYAAVAATSNKITLDQTNGSVVIGEWIEVSDFAAGIWQVNGVIVNTTGAAASVFSAV